MSTSKDIQMPTVDIQSTPPTNEVAFNQTPINILEDDNENRGIESHDTDVINENGKRPRRSWVRDYFDLKKINGQDKEICRYCEKKLGGSSKNGTSLLGDHFKSCPRRKSMDIKQAILNQTRRLDGKTQLTNFSFDQEAARDSLAKMITLHEYPLSMVEHQGFRNYSNCLQPLFKVPSRNTVKKDIFKIYEFEKTKTMELFRKNRGRFAITTDMWTSTTQKRGFMSVTSHFIDDSWKLQSRIVR